MSPIRSTIRSAGVVAGLLAGSLALSACSAGTSAAPEASAGNHGAIDVQLSWILDQEWSGEFIAQSEGYFTEAGFDEVNLVPGPSAGIAELLSGNVDVSLTDAVSVGAAIANEGAPVSVIGATFQKNPFTIASLADGADITEPEQMIGLRIGVQDSNRAVFEAFLAANGIGIDEVEIVPVQYDPAPLTTGEVDGLIAFVTSQSTTLELEGIEITDLLFADHGLPFVGHVVTATDEAVAEQRELLKDFLRAEIRGWTDAVADPAAGATLAVEEYGADLGLELDSAIASAEAQAQLLIVSDETAENGLFTISDELQRQTIESLVTAGYDIGIDDLFDLTLLDEVYDESPELLDAQR